jgi:hypothetical protein
MWITSGLQAENVIFLFIIYISICHKYAFGLEDLFYIRRDIPALVYTNQKSNTQLNI